MQTITLLYDVEHLMIIWLDFLLPSILFITDTTDFSKKTDMMKNTDWGMLRCLSSMAFRLP